MTADYIIVGTGLTGSVMARILKDRDFSVVMVERRNHLGGNVFDTVHESGIRVHMYGPHYFRTSNEQVWQFVNRFDRFYQYEAQVMVKIEDRYESWPVAGSYVRRLAGRHWKPEFTGTPQNFEEAALSKMPRVIYEQFVKEYSEKQWGVPCTELSSSLCDRFNVHEDDDSRLTPKVKYQGIPYRGYAGLMDSMVRGIPIVLNCDYLQHWNEFKSKKRTIFTGPIDEYFGFSLGRLAYRGQMRETTYSAGFKYKQPVAQVNATRHEDGLHIRTIEWKRITDSAHFAGTHGTVITKETPYSPIDPDCYEYPFPNQVNQNLYKKYRELADKESNVLICGRLGEYEYLDMDASVARAFYHVDRT
jgi:UDP-galactopyranose mutase